MTTEIADGSYGRCVARGISVMRLALGYELSLPFPIPPQTSEEMLSLIGEWFPEHKVHIFASEITLDGINLPENVIYEGENPAGYSIDSFLWAFSYLTSPGKAHFVVGTPEVCEGMQVHQSFAIELMKED